MSSFLKLENIWKVYPSKKGPKEALKGINLEVFEGEILALLGVNGAGKTTLSSIIASLHPPTKGQLFWKQEPVSHRLLEYRRHIGLCPQAENLDVHLTLEQNLLFQGRYYGLTKQALQKRVRSLLEQFKLEEYSGCKASVLSGGYKQRFSIARALVHQPSLVILDEPTVGLDPHVRHHLWEFIRDLKKEGISVVLTTHYLDEAEKLADRVCLIQTGQITTIDTPDNLKKICQKQNLEEVFLHLIETQSS